MCYIRIRTSYMREKLQATPTKQDLGTSWGILGDQSFPRSTLSFLFPPPHLGGPRRHLHSLCKTSDIDILDTVADCHATLFSGIVQTGTTKQSQVLTQLMSWQLFGLANRMT